MPYVPPEITAFLYNSLIYLAGLLAGFVGVACMVRSRKSIAPAAGYAVKILENAINPETPPITFGEAIIVLGILLNSTLRIALVIYVAVTVSEVSRQMLLSDLAPQPPPAEETRS